MTLAMKTRLSTMMFLEYFVWGAWYVTLGTWLGQTLHFSDQQIGLAAGTTAVGAMVAPFLVGVIADKFFPTQYVLAVLHFFGGILLFLAARQTDFTVLYVLILLYCFFFMPTLALTNSLAFRQMTDPKIEFGPIRVLGTIGWIVAGLCVGLMKWDPSPLAMTTAAGASIVMAIYCVTLPSTPPLAREAKFTIGSIFPREALSMLKERSMAVFAIASFLICIPLQFYYAFTNPFLNETGVQNAAAKMTGGQMSELFCMLLIPWFFRRLGVKYMLAAGMVAWVLRYVLFAFGAPTSDRMWMLWLGILLHGICYDFFFVTGQIYIDRKSAVALRAAAQGLITFITYGAGMFVGSYLSGSVVGHYKLASTNGLSTHDWRAIWLFAAAASAAVLLLFMVTFKDDDGETVRSAASEALSTEAPL